MKADAVEEVKAPEQVEINLVDESTQSAETDEESTKTSESAKATDAAPVNAISTSLAASGRGKRRASHAMTLPASVDDAFVDVALTAKADDARPSLVVSGKTAAMAQVSSKASAPTTLPKSADETAPSATPVTEEAPAAEEEK